MTIPHAGRAMSAERFAALLDAYGADPARWPADERAAAVAFARREDAAPPQRSAQWLDAQLDTLTAPPLSPRLRTAILAALPARVRVAPSWRALLAGLWHDLGGPRLVMPALAAALALGVGVGVWLPSPPDAAATDAADVLALAQFDDDFSELLP